MAVTIPRAGETGPALLLVSATKGPPNTPEQGLRMRKPDGVSLVPSEDVLLLAVDLPAMPASQRRASVGFAVEDRIAQSLDDVQVVLGPQVSPGLWLVAVVAKSSLANLTTDKTEAALWPDVLLVPVPRSGWAVWAGMERALVRLPDSTGFAAPSHSLPAFWAAAGSPDITLYGGFLPASLPITARAELPVEPDPTLRDFDLRAGRNGAGSRLYLPTGAPSFFLIAMVAAVAHLGLLVADVIALNQLASHKEAELRAMLNAPLDADLDAALTEALALRQPADGGRGVLGLLTQVFSAIGAQAGRVSVQSLRYVAAENEAVLTVEAPDLATLQLVQTDLSGTGLEVTAGAATSSDGAAEMQLTIRGAGA